MKKAARIQVVAYCHWTTRRYIREKRILHNYQYGNLKHFDVKMDLREIKLDMELNGTI
jgi:hypothetical protein